MQDLKVSVVVFFCRRLRLDVLFHLFVPLLPCLCFCCHMCSSFTMLVLLPHVSLTNIGLYVSLYVGIACLSVCLSCLSVYLPV